MHNSFDLICFLVSLQLSLKSVYPSFHLHLMSRSGFGVEVMAGVCNELGIVVSLYVTGKIWRILAFLPPLFACLLVCLLTSSDGFR